MGNIGFWQVVGITCSEPKGEEIVVKVKVCCKCKCKAVLFVFANPSINHLPFLMSGEMCGCPHFEGKYREHEVDNGVLVIWDEEESVAGE